MKKNKNISIGIIGLGYVGLPLYIEFSKKYPTIGYDINKERVNSLNNFKDYNNDIKLVKNSNYYFTNNIKELKNCNFFVVTVPTPLNKKKQPDLSFLKKASKDIGLIIKKEDTIVFESTVYPGATEEICIPIIEKFSQLKLNDDFHVGYSPERISPGEKKYNLKKIKKVISASNKSSLIKIKHVYKSIISAGLFVAKDIKTAEASKIVENVQRDLNISLMNELSFLFSKMKIDTLDVLKASSTKWNFLNFKPGLVGGHCIRVDPYYLTYKSKIMGYETKVISSGRAVNENIPKFIVKNLFNIIKKNGLKKNKLKVRVLGVTFKENCSDLRNSQVLEIIKILSTNKIRVTFEDYTINPKSLSPYYRKYYKKKVDNKNDILILAVAHDNYKKINIKKIKKILGKKQKFIFDLKGLLDKDYYIKNNFNYWRL
jgi:UDP-N-acetyl-D-galactosamine dehydrogenase